MTGGGGKASRMVGCGDPKGRRRPSPYDANTLDARLMDLFDWYASQPEGWPSESTLYRALRNPGRGSLVGGHRVLHDVPPRRLRGVHQAFVLLMPFGQRALMLRYGCLRDEEGRLITNRDRAAVMGISMRSWDRLLVRAKAELLETMRKPPGPLTAKARAWDS